MAGRHQFPRPEMGRTACFHADQARLQAGEKRAKLRTSKAAADNDITGSIDAVYLKNVLGQIQADCRNIHSDGASLNVAFNTTTLWHFDAGEQGPSTPSPQTNLIIK